MKAIKYIGYEDPKNHYNNVHIEYRGESGWAITQHGNCLNKEGEWEYEPMPSSRDDEFIESTRYKDEHEALAFYKKITKYL